MFFNGPNRYGPTAARIHDADGRARRRDTPTIDIHAHIVVPDGAKIAAELVDWSRVPLAHFANAQTKAINAQQDRDRAEVITQHDKRLKDMDAMAIDIQVIAPAPNQCYYTVDPKIAAKAHRVVNEGMATYCAKYPDRFVGLGTVTLQEPEQAVADLAYAMDECGLKGVQILTSINGGEVAAEKMISFC